MLAEQLGLGVVLQWKDKMSRQVKSAEGNLRNLRRTAKGTTESIEEQAHRAGLAMQRYQQGLRMSLKVAAAGAVLAAPFLISSKAAAESQQRLADVKSLLVGTMDVAEADKQIRGLKEAILGMAGDTMIPLADLETATYDLVSANLTAAEAQGALKPTADLAVAGMGSMKEAVETMAALLNTFALRWDVTLTPMEKANRIANILAGTIGEFKTTLPELSQAMQYAAGPANVLGIELEETAVAIGLLQTKGLKGTLAGTAYSAFLRQVTQLQNRFGESLDASTMSMDEYLELATSGKTKGGTSKKAAAAAKIVGIDIVDAQKRIRPIYDILEEIEKRFGITSEDIAEGQKKIVDETLDGAASFQAFGLAMEDSAALQAAFGDEGSRAIAMLLGQSQALRESIEIIRESDTLQARVTARQETLNAQWLITKNRIKAITITIGDFALPMLEALLGQVKRVVSWVGKLIEAHPTVAKWVTYGSLVGGVLLTMAGGLASVYFLLMMIQTQRALMVLASQGMVSKGVLTTLGNTVLMLKIRLGLLALWTKMVAAAQWLWNAAMTANPVGLIIVGIAALIAGIVLLVRNWDWVKATATSALRGMKGLLDRAPDWLLALIAPFLLIIKHWDWVKATATSALKTMKGLLDKAPDWLLALVAPFLLIIKHWDLVKEAGTSALDKIKESIVSVWEWMEKIVSKIRELLGWWAKLHTGIIGGVLGKLGLGGGPASPTAGIIPITPPIEVPKFEVPILLFPPPEILTPPPIMVEVPEIEVPKVEVPVFLFSPPEVPILSAPAETPMSLRKETSTQQITDYSNNPVNINLYPPRGADPTEIATAAAKIMEDKQQRGAGGRW